MAWGPPKALLKAPYMRVKTCLECGQAFKVKTLWQKFCTSTCRDRFHNKQRSGYLERKGPEEDGHQSEEYRNGKI